MKMHIIHEVKWSFSLLGTNGTVTTVPLNLSVGGTATVKVSQAATSSLIPSYLPITHANGKFILSRTHQLNGIDLY